MAEFAVQGARLVADLSGALWWPDERTLVVADLHLEKGSAYAARRQFLPPYDTAATLARLADACRRLQPKRVIALGDSFHDKNAMSRIAAEDVLKLKALAAAHDWVWIEGNHDPHPPEDLGGTVMETLTLGPLVFRHEPTPGHMAGEIAGHLHPCASVGARGRSFRRRCFISDGTRAVLPAFGAYAGGLDVFDVAFQPLFPQDFDALLLGGERVYAFTRRRLAVGF